MLALQAALFHQHAVREVAWAYPAFHDQASYLDASYRAYEEIKRHGWREGLLAAGGVRPRLLAPSPAGSLLYLEAVLAFCVLGPARMSALWLGFAHFALFQLVLVWTLRAMIHRWSIALTALGLLLCARAPFRQPGGIFDFRLDFMTLCLFGVFVCVVIRSAAFADRRWAIAAGLAAAWVLAFRFLTAAYFAPIFAALLVVVGRSRRRNVLLAGGIAALLGMGVLWRHRASLGAYYVGGHLRGIERYIRAEHEGVGGPWGRLTFYPKSVVVDHAGPAFLIVATVVVLVLRWARTLKPAGADPNVHDPGNAGVSRLRWFASLCAVVPLAVLIVDVDKSRVVSGIMLPPLVWLILLPAMKLPAPLGTDRSQPVLERRLALLTAFALAMGLACQISRFMATERSSRHPADANRVLALCDRVCWLAQERKLSRPRIVNDSHADYLAASAIDVMSYERQHILLNADETLANTLSPRPEAQVFEILRQADFVILTRHQRDFPGEYPFDRQMEALHSRLLAFCEQHLRRDMSFNTRERSVTLYVRGVPTGEPAECTPTTRQTAAAGR